ncbi:MAG: hypothetical protein R6V00_12855 [Candidatus Aminicenantes bacterium]
MADQIITHTPVKEFKQGEKLKVAVQTQKEIEWMMFFYRTEGWDQFQVRKMEKSSETSYSYLFDTSQLVFSRFDYYLSYKSNHEILTYPKKAPEETFQVSGKIKEESSLPSAGKIETEKKGFKLPEWLYINGSLQQEIWDKDGSMEGEQTFTADGNLNVSQSFQKENFQINLNMNTRSANHPLDGNQNFQLSRLKLSAKSQRHSLKIGDISLTGGSDYTVFGLGRRGAEYQFQNQKFLFHLFDISSQQQQGWEGLVPQSDLNLYGGMVGYRLFKQKLTLKAVYLSGKDNPAEGRNVAGLSLDKREGNTWALIEDLKIFDDKLKLFGEFAQSWHDDNLEDEEAGKRDAAWKIGGNLSHGIFELSATYKNIGKDFNPIGHQYFINDRKGYQTRLGISSKKINVNLSYLDERNNIEEDPDRLTSYSKLGSAYLSLVIFKWFSFNSSYQINQLKTYSRENKKGLFRDLSTNDYSLGFNFILSPSSVIDLSAIYSEIQSSSNPASDSAVLTTNLGGNIKLCKNLSFYPFLSYSLSRNEITNVETEIYNSFLSAELALIPSVISVSTSSSFNRTTTGSENIDSLNISSYLNFYMGSLIKQLANAVVCLRGDLRKVDNADHSEIYETVFLQFNFSF